MRGFMGRRSAVRAEYRIWAAGLQIIIEDSQNASQLVPKQSPSILLSADMTKGFEESVEEDLSLELSHAATG